MALLLVVLGIGLWSIWGGARTPLYTPYNLGFEGETLDPWVAKDAGACDLSIIDDPTRAHQRNRFLLLQKLNEDCFSVHQDKTVKPALNARHSFVVWVRSPDGAPRTGTVVLWQGIAPIGAPGHGVKDNSEKAATDFLVVGDNWSCVEVSNHLQDERYDLVRGAIYLDGGAGIDLLIDSAGFHAGSTAGCPPAQGIQLIDGGFEHDELFSAWQWLADQCEYAIMEDADNAQEGIRYLSMRRTDDECRSIQQRVSTTVGQGQTVRGGLWVRTSDEDLRDLTLTVRALDTGDEASHPFRINPEWQCYEVAMETSTGGSGEVQLEVYFDEPSEDEPVYEFDGAFLTTDPAIGCPPQTETLVNVGYENPTTLLPWEWNGICTFDVVTDPTRAFEGERFLFVQLEDERCISFHQEIPVYESESLAAFTAGIWARATDATPRTAVLRLNQTGQAEQVEFVRFSPISEQWQCFETTLRVPYLKDEFIYFEVFPEHIGEGGYLFDNAMLVVGEQPVCPQTRLGIRGLQADSTEGRFYPGAAIGVKFDLVNVGPSDALQAHFVCAWVSESADGPPIALPEVAQLLLPPLEAGGRSENVHLDVAIPLATNPDQTYYVVVEADPNSSTDGEEGLGRDSLAFDLSQCHADSLFCDVPADYWSRTEIEEWHEGGITSGCRSGTAPYSNRPYCPDTVVNRDMFAVLLLRQMLGGDYQPPAEYLGRYEDVAEDARFVHWIEDLENHGVQLPSEGCPADGDTSRFCPDLPMTRGEVALVLADVLDWELADVEQLAFDDIAADDPANAAISKMWTEGIISVDDPHCPQVDGQLRFCPDERLHRDAAAFMLVRAFQSE